ncbi:MAG TPA: TolC family protein [Parvibaculum sp.]
MTVSAPVAAQTIDDAMTLAVRNHPAVKAQAYEVDAAGSDVDTAVSGYFPTLSVDGSVRREKTKQAFSEQTLTPQNYSVTLTQPIFDGLATPARVATAESAADAEKFDAQSVVNDAALDAANAYLAVLETRERLVLLQSHEKRARNIAQRIEQRAAADTGLRSLTVVGHSETEQARFLVLDAQRDVALAETHYRELIGTSPEDLKEPVEPVELLNMTGDEAVDQATRAHPALASARARAKAADSERDVARSVLFPRLDAEFQARNGRDIDGVRGDDDSYYAGLRLTYKFSTGGGNLSDVSAASYREQAASMRIQDVARKVRLGVLDMLENFQASRTTHSVLARRKASASEIVRVYDAQFIGGQRDLLDLFFVLNEERTANVAELEARFAELRSAYGVLAAIGELGQQVAGAR